MALVNESQVSDLIVQLGSLGKWLQALGIIIIAWIVFQVISLVINLRRRKLLEDMDERIKRIERKVDKLGKKK